MPWKETNVLNERMRFIVAWQAHEDSMTDLCHHFGISRTLGYELILRYKEFGLDGLKDSPKAPHSHPNATPPEIEKQIIELRSKHPKWGAGKLLAILENTYPNTSWPAESTVGQILKRNGMIASKRYRRAGKVVKPFVPLTADDPNAVWCADFKGHFKTKDGKYCYPLTITDANSRMILRCQGLWHPDTASSKPVFVAAFREYGIPLAIRTDNGSPFAGMGLGGLTTLSVWWIKLGIRLDRIQPGHPEQNGRHERMHRTLKAEATTPPEMDLRSQQKVFDRFRDEYNNLRPHEALGMKTPSSVYTVSPREYPLRLPEIEYPSSMAVRSVHTEGAIRWKGNSTYVSESLIGERVGLSQLDDRRYALYFGSVLLAVFDETKDRLLPDREASMVLQNLRKENHI